jgi:hypothetical protein
VERCNVDVEEHDDEKVDDDDDDDDECVDNIVNGSDFI